MSRVVLIRCEAAHRAWARRDWGSPVYCVRGPRGAFFGRLAKPHQIHIRATQSFHRRQYCGSQQVEVLGAIVFPDGFFASPEIFTSLARARPSLKELYFEDGSFIDDACVAVLCETLKLEKLQIDSNRSRLTPAVVDIILRSPTAETLSWACFSNTYAFTSGGILRLARNCPRLAQIIWRVQGLWPLVDGNGKNVDDLTALLRERCRGHSDWYFSVDPFRKFGPWKLSEVSWAYRDYPNPHSEPQGFYT